MLPPLEDLKARLETAVPGCQVEIIPNELTGQPSLLLDSAHAFALARWLRDEPSLQLDYSSNVTGVDWLDSVRKETVKVKKLIGDQEQEVEETIETTRPGFLEVVYHLYSMALRHGPLIIRLRTGNRSDQVSLPSLTPLWRGAEFQEREVYDLYGVHFEGHPDLRRLLMWEGFGHHPMRKDFVPPDDFEYGPTPHDEVLQRAKAHSAKLE